MKCTNLELSPLKMIQVSFMFQFDINIASMSDVH